MLDRIKKIDIELLIFVLCIFLQNFAIISTKDFGISCIVLFLIYVFFRYNYIKKLNVKFIAFNVISLLFVALNYVFNDIFAFTQVVRYFLVAFVVFTGYYYVKDIIDKSKTDLLLKYCFIVTTIICVYGIYQFIASLYDLPMFLNIFNNNPSYAVRHIHETYGGWVKIGRIYGVFFEPSIYAIFLSNLFFIFLLTKKDDYYYKLSYFIPMVLIFFNILLTFSRAGWIVFLIYFTVYIFNKLFRNNDLLKKMFKFSIIILPFIVFVAMYTIGLMLFKDNSSLTRTYSSLFYLKRTFSHLKYILIGHGLGSISMPNFCNWFHRTDIEPFTHNGFIEVLYQFGLIYFIYAIYKINKFISKTIKSKSFYSFAAFSSLLCFGAHYNIDSLVVLIIIFILIASKYDRSME